VIQPRLREVRAFAQQPPETALEIAAMAIAGGRFGRRYITISTRGSATMSVAKITEISSTSTKSFDDAIQQGIARANQTLRNIRSAWIKEQQVRVDKGRVTEYQVNMLVTFVLED
jgi:flavin-binding protein dodecin